MLSAPPKEGDARLRRHAIATARSSSTVPLRAAAPHPTRQRAAHTPAPSDPGATSKSSPKPRPTRLGAPRRVPADFTSESVHSCLHGLPPAPATGRSCSPPRAAPLSTSVPGHGGLPAAIHRSDPSIAAHPCTTRRGTRTAFPAARRQRPCRRPVPPPAQTRSHRRAPLPRRGLGRQLDRLPNGQPDRNAPPLLRRRLPWIRGSNRTTRRGRTLHRPPETRPGRVHRWGLGGWYHRSIM